MSAYKGLLAFDFLSKVTTTRTSSLCEIKFVSIAMCILLQIFIFLQVVISVFKVISVFNAVVNFFQFAVHIKMV